ncbi:hypothetical protein Q8F55_005937 [Vanrija albida]|uniref:F-box domain-containing protein n=1 Tax=Vanrija albida TaxID=181172 RepID=A0ABR3Q2Y1_9TREE
MPSTHYHDPQPRATALPPELLIEVIGYLDPVKDKATLHSLLSVSRTVSAIAMPPLYTRLKLNEAQFAQLVHGGRDPARQQRFSLIQHLELCPPPSADTMATVYQSYSTEWHDFVVMSKAAEGYAQEPMVIYSPSDDHIEYQLAHNLAASRSYWPYWDPSTAQCLEFDDDPPPCNVCGCSLLFVSQTVGAIAIKPLYARLKLDETHFAQLVNGGRDDPLRQQRFSLIHHLELCPPPSAETMATVYQAVGDQGDPAVFPNVKTLRLEHRDHWKEEDDAFLERRDKGDGPPGLPPKGLVLFDSPDVCIRGRFFAVEALEYLPSRSVSNSTLIVHTAFLEAIHRSTIPRGWRQLVVYYTDINGIMYSDEQREFATMSKPAEGYSQEPMLIYCPNDDHHEGSLANSLWAMQRHWPYWDPSTAQCLVFDDDAPPCSICGCRWEDFWDEADEEHKPKRIGDLLPTPSEPTKQSVKKNNDGVKKNYGALEKNDDALKMSDDGLKSHPAHEQSLVSPAL